MKKIISATMALCMAVAAVAQEGKPFATASLGTQGTGDTFRGATVSLGVGYNWKGLDMGIGLDYYNDKWGRGMFHYTNSLISTNDYSIMQIYDGKRNEASMTLRFTVAYDPLRFVRGNWRHHLRPTVGLGYSQRNQASSWSTNDGTWQNVEMREQTQNGFELTLGIAYDFSITRQWSVGAFFEEFVVIREQDIMGLRARYTF